MRVILKLGRACNNACVFCHAPDRRVPFEPLADLQRKAQQARQLGASMIILSGGEPTLHPDLLALATHIAGSGMRLGLITNGRRLADPTLLDALLHAGLDYVYLSLHASSARLHDALVRAPAFHQTFAALQNLHARIPDLTVNTVVTPVNLHDLRALVDLLRPLSLLRHKFTFPQPKGSALDQFDQTVPSLRLAANAVADAIHHGAACTSNGRPRHGHEGFPHCLLPGLEHLHDDLRTHHIAFMAEPHDERLAPIDELPRAQPPQCVSCQQRSSCPGIYLAYALRRGTDELNPTPAEMPALPDPTPVAHPGDQREQAAHERRAWVRLTYACNNRCRFCLDRDSGKSGARSLDEIRRELLEARKQGAQRLVLSGGEPTTHPGFIQLVRLGKRAGYRWVQVVSNGRMFSYPDFLQRAIDAGLDELTVSMHGHTPELHDALVGAPGAFDQSAAAVRAALASRRLVVNIDIVINGWNVAHLPSMLETFARWGVREFDLLQVIPFGAAWRPDHRDLFYDLREHAEVIRSAIGYAQREGLHVWLNRFPPAHAEGFEHLLQDPHKLHDEVRGRLEPLQAFLRGGPPLPCRDALRCSHCYLETFCSAMHRARALATLRPIPLLRARAPIDPRRTISPTSRLEIIADDAAQALRCVHRVPANAYRLQLADFASLRSVWSSASAMGRLPLEALVVDTSVGLQHALALDGTHDIEVLLNTDTAEALPALGAHVDRLIVVQPTYATSTEALRRDVEPWPLLRELPSVRTRGIPPCLGGDHSMDPLEATELEALEPDGSLHPMRWTTQFVRELFLVKSLRCAACARDDSCRGVHINWVRAHGFARLRPFAKSSQ